VLFSAAPTSGSFEEANVDVFSSKTGQRKTLVRGGYFARYVPSASTGGHLVYIRAGTLYGVPFDPARLELAGTAVPLLDDAATTRANGAGQFNFSGVASGAGTLVYRKGNGSELTWPVEWLDSAGKTQPLLAKPGNYNAPRLSPDGQRLALAVTAGKVQDAYVYDLQRDIISRLTFTGGTTPIWAPDGKHLVVSEGSSVWWVRADGAGEPQRLMEDTTQSIVYGYSFSPDGLRLAYMSINSETSFDIWVLPLDVSDPDHPKPGKPEPFLRTKSSELEPVFSPDGRWIAYRSNESGVFELYVRPSQNSAGGGKWQISNGGRVQHPLWPREGRQLFYQTLDNQIMVADYTVQGDSFVAGKPRLWSPAQILAPSGLYNMDVTADGKRMVVFPRPDVKEDTGSVHVTFLLNFFDELRRRAPVAK
jgi:hypothetical protein